MDEMESRIDYRDPKWVASRLGLDKNTVYRLLQEGTLPGVQIGKKWLISETRLAALNASISAWVPNVFATNICLSRPIRLEITSASITVPAALAICLLADDVRSKFTIHDYIRGNIS